MDWNSILRELERDGFFPLDDWFAEYTGNWIGNHYFMDERTSRIMLIELTPRTDVLVMRTRGQEVPCFGIFHLLLAPGVEDFMLERLRIELWKLRTWNIANGLAEELNME